MKTKTSKSRKIDIFPKGLTHRFGPKMAIFPNFFFQAIQARKMSFTIFQNKKKPPQAIKTRSSKSRKIDIFPHGLTHGFGLKMAIFLNCFFLGNLGKENVFYDILQQKIFFLGSKSKKLKKSKNCLFSKGVNPWFWSKNGHFPNFFFLCNIGQDNVFYDILQLKNSFLGYENKNFEKSKN